MAMQHDWDIPEFQMADRMRLSLRKIGATGEQAAEYFRCTPNTISNWLNGKTHPSKLAMRTWAMWTGVPLIWLETGEKPPSGGDDGLALPRLDSNQEPAVYWLPNSGEHLVPFSVDLEEAA